MSKLRELRKLAERHGLTLTERPNGHVQILDGQVLVNYYPDAKKRSCYVAGMTEGMTHITPKQAIQFALDSSSIPTKHLSKAHRKSSYTRHKLRMLRKHPYCYWCEATLDKDTATVEHIIPLSRGGLDNNNNRALACKRCNHARRNNMPTKRAK